MKQRLAFSNPSMSGAPARPPVNNGPISMIRRLPSPNDDESDARPKSG